MWEGNQKENYYVFMSRQPYFPSKPAPYSAQPVLLLIVPLFSMALKLYCDIFRVSRDTKYIYGYFEISSRAQFTDVFYVV